MVSSGPEQSIGALGTRLPPSSLSSWAACLVTAEIKPPESTFPRRRRGTWGAQLPVRAVDGAQPPADGKLLLSDTLCVLSAMGHLTI